MQKPYCLLGAVMVCALLVFSVRPLQGADKSGKWELGLHGGAYKLVLTDHSDAWTLGWLGNADVKYGFTPKFGLGVEGSWMQTNLADLSDGSKLEDGAGLTTKSVSNGPRQRAFVAGLIGEYRFMEEGRWSPYVSFGSGMYIWKWIDKDGNTLWSDDAALSAPEVGTAGMPQLDKGGNPYELKDQELYLMGGLGLEVAASEVVSFELGANFRYLTHLFSSFKDDQDIVGTGSGELDLPTGVAEVYTGLTFHFGGKCPPSTCTASASPTSGAAPLMVMFSGSAAGGCPEYTYAWDFGDGSTSDEQNPSYTYNAVGDYFASLTVTDSKGNIAQNSVPVTVSCPMLNSTASVSPTSGTAPLAVHFMASASGGCPPITYSWEFGDGAMSSEQNPSHTYNAAGDYKALLTVTDAEGTTSQKTVSMKAAEPFVPEPEKPLVLEGVNFETNKAVLLESSKEILDRVAASLILHPEVNVEVGGYCDSDGSDAYNLKLSGRRANTVRDYLINHGVPAANLTARGYGEANPIADNNTPEGKAKNRRVELKRM